MAKATEEQVRALEKAHKEQFILLVRVAQLWQQMALLFAKYPDTDSRKKALLQYGDFFRTRLARWLKLEVRLAKAGVKTILPYPAVSPSTIFLFFDRKNMPELQKLAKSIDAEGQGISGVGFVPLLIWAVVAIIGAFTATEITDELNTTAEEKQELLDETAKRCKELNLTGDACAKLISQTQAEVSSGGGKILLLLALAAAVMLFMKNRSNSSAAKAA